MLFEWNCWSVIENFTITINTFIQAFILQPYWSHRSVCCFCWISTNKSVYIDRIMSLQAEISYLIMVSKSFSKRNHFYSDAPNAVGAFESYFWFICLFYCFHWFMENTIKYSGGVKDVYTKSTNKIQCKQSFTPIIRLIFDVIISSFGDWQLWIFYAFESTT